MILSDLQLFKDRFIRAQEGWQSKTFFVYKSSKGK